MKTKKLLFILTFLSVSSTMMAQTTPHFETALYIEDAVGNRDTVYFGFDPLATEDIDEDFGEEVLNTPFDSVLDARFTPPFSDAYFTKRIINKTANTIDGCWGGSGSFLYVHAIHQPVTISWAEADFYDECFRGGNLIDNILSELAFPISPEEIPQKYYCMADISNGDFFLTEDSLFTGNIASSARLELEIDINGEMETVYGLALNVGPIFMYTPCFWVTATEEPAGIEKVALFSNPAKESVELQLSPNVRPEQVTIYDGVGRILAQYPYKSTAIDITYLPSGIFIVEMLADDGRRYVARGVKNN